MTEPKAQPLTQPGAQSLCVYAGPDLPPHLLGGMGPGPLCKKVAAATTLSLGEGLNLPSSRQAEEATGTQSKFHILLEGAVVIPTLGHLGSHGAWAGGAV